MSPTRVLIVAPSLDILGGQAIQAARLYERLREERSLSVAFLPVNPKLPGVWSALQRVKYLRTLITFPYYLVTVVAKVRRYDVIHIFSASYLSFLLAPTPAILATRLWKRRCILNYRSGEAEDHLRRWRRTALATVKLADKVIVPSGYLQSVFEKVGVKTIAIPNFVDLGVFRFRERRELNPIFLSNRNLESLYDVSCTVEAFALIQAAIPNASLLIAGDGSQREALEEQVRRKRLRHVTFLGKVQPEEMGHVYYEADIYLNSSVIDNMPTSIIEAFACGLPVVTSNAGGISYMVEHDRTGLVFEKGNAVAMAHQVMRIFQEPELAPKLISNARKECDRYRWSTVCRSWLAAYHEK